MKFLLLISLFGVLVAAVTAATSMGYGRDPKHPRKCLVNGLLLSPGDTAQQPGCGRIVCYGDGKYESHSCGVKVSLSENTLENPINLDLPYPDCC